MPLGIQIEDESLADSSIETEEIASTTTYQWNHITNRLSKIIEDKESLKQSIEMMLEVERCIYPIYSSGYGREFEQLLGAPKHFVEAEIKRLLQESIKRDNRVLDITNIRIDFEEDKAICNFEILSIYGSIDSKTEVSL